MSLEISPVINPQFTTVVQAPEPRSIVYPTLQPNGTAEPDSVQIVSRIQDQTDFQGPVTDGFALVWDDSSQKFVMSAVSVSAAGSDGQIQFSDNGSFGASSALVWDDAEGLFAISGKQTIESDDTNAILFSLHGIASQAGHYFQVKNSDDKLLTAFDSSGRWLIPDGGSYGADQKLRFFNSNQAYAGSAVLEIKRAEGFTSNGFGSILKLADNNASCDIRMMARTFVQGLYDLEFTNYLGQKVFGSPYLGGCYFWNGSAYSNLNEAAMTIPTQTMAPGGGGDGYIYQSPLAVQQCLYFLNGVTKVEHLSSIWVEGPPTFHNYYTNPENVWSIDCGIGKVKATGFAAWKTTTGTGAKQRQQFAIEPTWLDDEEGSQMAEVSFNVNDYDSARTVITIGADGTEGKLGFFGSSPVVKQTAENIGEVIAALQAYGLLT